MKPQLYNAVYLDRLHQFLSKTKNRSLELLSPCANDKIVDVGCGLGDDVLAIADTGATAIGIDNNTEYIYAARQKNNDISFICAEADAIPLGDSSVNKIRFDRILQHIEVHAGVFKEASRLLKTGGMLQIVEPDYLSWSFFLEDEKFDQRIMQSVAYDRLNGARLTRKIPSDIEPFGFVLTGVEVHNYMVTEFELANYIVRFDKTISEGFERGIFTEAEVNLWHRHINKPKGQFNLSINIILYTAIKM